MRLGADEHAIGEFFPAGAAMDSRHRPRLAGIGDLDLEATAARLAGAHNQTVAAVSVFGGLAADAHARDVQAIEVEGDLGEVGEGFGVDHGGPGQMVGRDLVVEGERIVPHGETDIPVAGQVAVRGQDAVRWHGRIFAHPRPESREETPSRAAASSPM